MFVEQLGSSLVKKALVAVTGLALLGFVIAHLLGNLTIFLGADALNAYALKISHFGPLLWAARIMLLAAVVVHIVTTALLTIENRRARPVAYAMHRTQRTTLSAKTMVLSGLIILAFVLYHLAHFTFRVTHPAISNLTDALGRHDVYTMVVVSFRQPLVAGFYLVALALLCLHLSHGIASVFQTLGLANEATLPFFERAGASIAGLLFLGYASIPLSAWLGLLKIPGGAG